MHLNHGNNLFNPIKYRVPVGWLQQRWNSHQSPDMHIYLLVIAVSLKRSTFKKGRCALCMSGQRREFNLSSTKPTGYPILLQIRIHPLSTDGAIVIGLLVNGLFYGMIHNNKT